MNTLVLGIATRMWPGWQECVRSWNENANEARRVMTVCNQDIVPAYQSIYEDTSEDIIGFVHDDVQVYERGWDSRVLLNFSDPTIGIVGFGGGRGHGRPDLYKVPYRLQDLARQDFISNMRSAEVHGRRFTGDTDVAVIDGFAGFVRRSVLDKWGGFPSGPEIKIGYYMIWENLCCEARRQGMRIRMAGVDCEHIGGRTSTIHQVSSNYDEEHWYFYDKNRDVMPFKV